MAPDTAPFDSSNLVYREALKLLADIAMDDERFTDEERLTAQERAFGICVGIATMLVPGVYQTSLPPPPETADHVCDQVTADMEKLIREEYLDGRD